IPVDHVTRQAYALSLRGTRALGVFHLTNPAPPSTGELLTALTANCAAPVPEFVADVTALDREDRLLDMALGIYRPFLVNAQRFSRHRIDAVLAVDHDTFEWTPDADTLRALFLPFAGLPGQRRPFTARPAIATP